VKKTWRAVPIFAFQATKRLRDEASRNYAVYKPTHDNEPYTIDRDAPNTGTETTYSILTYVLTIPPLRSLVSLYNFFSPDRRGAPAHCASLTARVLRKALEKIALPHPSAWFSPTTLFLELSSRPRMLANKQKIDDGGVPLVNDAIEHDGEAEEAIEMFKNGSIADATKVSRTAARRAIALLSKQVVEAAVVGEPTEVRDLQISLANALLKEALLARPYRERLPGRYVLPQF